MYVAEQKLNGKSWLDIMKGILSYFSKILFCPPSLPGIGIVNPGDNLKDGRPAKGRDAAVSPVIRSTAAPSFRPGRSLLFSSWSCLFIYPASPLPSSPLPLLHFLFSLPFCAISF